MLANVDKFGPILAALEMCGRESIISELNCRKSTCKFVSLSLPIGEMLPLRAANVNNAPIKNFVGEVEDL